MKDLSLWISITAGLWFVYYFLRLIFAQMDFRNEDRMDRVWRIRRYYGMHPEKKPTKKQEDYLKKYGHLYDDWLKGES